MSNDDKTLPSDTQERERVLAKAVVNAAQKMGISVELLAELLALEDLPPAAAALNLKQGSGPYERAALIVRIYSALEGLLGADTDAKRAWLSAKNRDFDASPIETMKREGGLSEVVEYLEHFNNS